MFGDILRSFFVRPVTQKYPFERKPAPARLRGGLIWNPEKCSGCGLCAKDCPSNALEVIILDRPSKRFVVRYQVDRCTFCAQCVQNCRFKCIELSNGSWELASLSKASFDQLLGSQANIDEYVERSAGESPAAG
jgi:formate hydrogenlyase subunit 6/NADH:ubiquinone oxidoreductase subunit I